MMPNEPGLALNMVQQLCIGAASNGIDSTKQKVIPCTAAVRLIQLFTTKVFKIFFAMKNGTYGQKNTLIGKETWFSFRHGIEIGDAKALAL